MDKVFGRNPVTELLKSDAQVEKLYVNRELNTPPIQQIMRTAKQKGIIVSACDGKKLDFMSGNGAHQGVLAVISQTEYCSVDDLLQTAQEKGEPPFLVMLDGIEDPHNLGAIIRSCNVAGVHGVIIPKHRAAGVNATVYKASAGAVNYTKVAKVSNLKNTMEELKEALAWNYGKGLDEQSVKEITTGILREMTESGAKVDADTAAAVLKSVMNAQMAPEKMARYQEIHDMIAEVPKFGNDIPEVDYFARDVAYTYTRPLQNFKNPRGGQYQAGLYPVSANVPLGGQTGATPDGRYAHTPVADGVSPSAGKDVNGPTAAASSVAKLDHFIVSNGTLFNQKFHPSALSGREGLEKFVALIRSYFDQKGMHMQFNVVSRETLLDAQAHPENYKHLVVRVAGYSALFTTLSKSLQDDIIRRTEQGF